MTPNPSLKRSTNGRTSLFALLVAALPSLALAEVMDKQFSFSTVIGLSVATLATGFFAARYRPVLLALVMPVLGLFWFAHAAELLDPHVGPAIAREAGVSYLAISLAGIGSLFAGPVFGLLLRRRVARSKT